MKSQANFLERRTQPRVGVMAQLEDIAYGILRKHGVGGVGGGAGNEAGAAKSVK